MSGGPEEGGFEVTYHDVSSFGVVLMGLIAKRIVDEKDTWKTFVYCWAWKQYKPNRSLVHESLVEDPGYYASDGILITELAMHCIQMELDKLPSMKDVVKRLEGSQVVQLCACLLQCFQPKKPVFKKSKCPKPVW